MGFDIGQQSRRGQLAQRHARHRRSQRIATEGGAVAAELQRLRSVFGHQHRADGKTAAQPFRQRHDIRHDTIPLMRPELAAAAHAGLDLVEHQQRANLIATRTQMREETRRRRHDTALALHRLDQHRRHIGIEQRIERGHIVERGVTETAGQRLETLLVFGCAVVTVWCAVNEPLKLMMVRCCGARPAFAAWRRTSLIAAPLASARSCRRTRAMRNRLRLALSHRSGGSLRKMLLVCQSLSACSCSAARMSGSPCPSALTAMPAAKSTYCGLDIPQSASPARDQAPARGR